LPLLLRAMGRRSSSVVVPSRCRAVGSLGRPASEGDIRPVADIGIGISMVFIAYSAIIIDSDDTQAVHTWRNSTLDGAGFLNRLQLRSILTRRCQ